MKFKDRKDAGKQLANALQNYIQTNAVVIGLPRGGVPVAYAVAKILKLPMRLLIVRKLGAPFNKEYGIGAIAEKRSIYLDAYTIDYLGLPDEKLNEIIAQEEKEILHRQTIYHTDFRKVNLKNKTAIIVDDGIATGSSIIAAVYSVREKKPKKIILAAPVCAKETAKILRHFVNEMICIAEPQRFVAVAKWYEHFPQVTDEEVIQFIKAANSQ